jgi:streptogramin lyase
VTSIFISYRRDDEPAAAGRLYDSLVAALGAESVFIDVDGIKPGVDFVDVLEDVLRRCDVLVAVVGRHWLEATDAGGRPRLEDPEDFVRLELLRAMQRSDEHGDIRVLPLCVEGGRMPRPDEIPPELAGFARLQAFTLGHVTWRRDVANLLEWLQAQVPDTHWWERLRRGPARLRRSTRALIAGGVVLVSAGVGVAIALSGGDHNAGSGTGAIVGEPTPLRGRPTAIAAGAGGIWVTEEQGVVEQIDPSTGRVRGAPIQVDGEPLGVAVGAGAVWVACKHVNDDKSVTGSVIAIDPTTRRPLGPATEVGSQPRDVAIGEGAVWTANVGDGSVTRIDPQSRKAHTYYFNPRGQPADIAVGSGSVWMVQYANQTLVRINPATGKVLQRVPVARNPESVVVGAGGVWVASLSRDSVTKVDPKTNEVVGQPIVVGSHPDDLAIWQDAVYVAAKDEGVIQRIDPESLRVTGEPLKVGNEPDALAVYEDRLWVANAADTTVVQVTS